ncbi:BON domain-containing protein [Dactylosporangium roseum]|uniref:BON domain-containing protein n=1 Tax=Dactylosporangium roseum TaxID=47989 RepID=A0ABY5ZG35_9ACTN|nr:BON domain-containing protein [Dactylosporangium roseum]
MTDQDIAQAASQFLEWAVDVPPNAVTADVQDHKITLSGHFAWEYQRNAAARAVTYLKGVTQVSKRDLARVAAAVRRHQGNGRGRDAAQR